MNFFPNGTNISNNSYLIQINIFILCQLTIGGNSLSFNNQTWPQPFPIRDKYSLFFCEDRQVNIFAIRYVIDENGTNHWLQK